MSVQYLNPNQRVIAVLHGIEVVYCLVTVRYIAQITGNLAPVAKNLVLDE